MKTIAIVAFLSALSVAGAASAIPQPLEPETPAPVATVEGEQVVLTRFVRYFMGWGRMCYSDEFGWTTC